MKRYVTQALFSAITIVQSLSVGNAHDDNCLSKVYLIVKKEN